MSAIKAGDMVQLVWACCAKGRRHIGWTGIAGAILDYHGSACFCDYRTYGKHAEVDIGGPGIVPLSWLIKIDPPAIPEQTEHTEELTS